MYLHEWQLITDDTFVLNAISGYFIPFREIPRQFCEPVQLEFSESQNRQIDICISKLINIGAVIEVQPTSPQFISKIFAVPKSDGSYRLILNLKKINEFIDTIHFKMEDYRTVCNLLTMDAVLASIDLQDAYHLIPVAVEHQRYLRFKWRGNLFQYTCLPFGLATAPRVFTKVMRPVMSKLRSKGNASVQYLDDIFLIGSNKKQCDNNIRRTKSLLCRLGFLINLKKSNLVGTKKLQYLGFEFDTRDMTLSLPQSKRENLIKLCEYALKKPQLTIQSAAELIGSLVAASPAVPYSLLYTRQLEYEKSHSLTLNKNNYKSLMSFSSLAKGDIQWWIKHLPCSKTFIRKDSFDVVIETDASLTGWGARYENQRTHGYWNAQQSTLHINILELLAAELAIQSFFRNFENKTILIRLDNTTAIAYINRFGGCRSPELHEIAKRIWFWCENHGNWLKASYISSAQNYAADTESRRVYDSDSEWSLDSGHFQSISIRFGAPTLDLFASHLNFKCESFVSWHPDPKSKSVDAFTISWKGIFFYAFPPFCLIPRVLRKIRNDKARGIVVVPMWTAQAWYPMFMSMKVSEVIILGPSKDLIKCPLTNRPHQMYSSLRLMAAVLSSTL